MKTINKLFYVIFVLTVYSCANMQIKPAINKEEKKYYSSSGFALIYEKELHKQKIINKKIDNDSIQIMHNFLKVNTPVHIINPQNSKVVEAKISKRASYPKIFNSVITEKIATILELDRDNPYIIIDEIKKNKTFIAKKSNTFEEEKNVAEKAPVKEIKVDDLSSSSTENIISIKKKKKSYKYILVISDFYYEDSAINLKDELVKKTQMKNLYIKKINNTKYRLLLGPFENFNALKTSYISLNNLGFEDLNIYKE